MAIAASAAAEPARIAPVRDRVERSFTALRPCEVYDRNPFNEISDCLMLAINALLQACVQRTGLTGESSGRLAPRSSQLCSGFAQRVDQNPTSGMIAAAGVPRHVVADQERSDLMLPSGTWTAHNGIQTEYIQKALAALNLDREVVRADKATPSP
jgi:hypothetical protein